eukprot:363804-Chlamydomonas_euryale.AAC.8
MLREEGGGGSRGRGQGGALRAVSCVGDEPCRERKVWVRCAKGVDWSCSLVGHIVSGRCGVRMRLGEKNELGLWASRWLAPLQNGGVRGGGRSARLGTRLGAARGLGRGLARRDACDAAWRSVRLCDEAWRPVKCCVAVQSGAQHFFLAQRWRVACCRLCGRAVQEVRGWVAMLRLRHGARA